MRPKVVRPLMPALRMQILCFERLMLPTGEEKRARELAVQVSVARREYVAASVDFRRPRLAQDLRSCVKSLCLTGVVKVFGSWKTGLTLPVR